MNVHECSAVIDSDARRLRVISPVTLCKVVQSMYSSAGSYII